MRRHFLALVGFLSLLFLVCAVHARPGGGSSFKGGSSSSRSGGSSYSGGGGSSYSGGGSSYSGGGGTTYRSTGSGGSMGIGGVITLLVLFAIVAVVVNVAKSKAQGAGWTAGHGPMNAADFFPQPPAVQVPRSSARKDLERLREADPGFSLVVFDDFVNAIYGEILLARGRGELMKFTAYLAPPAYDWLMQRPLDGLTNVLVGALSLHSAKGLEPTSQRVTVEVDFESNLSRRDAQTGQEQALYVRERWTLGRAKTAKSRTPDKARVFTCPNCGSPLSEIFGGKCRHCGQNVASGAFDWVVESIFVEATEPRGPMLTGTTEEVGNDLPTVFDPNVQQAFGALQQKDPALEWNALTGRMNLIFQTFQRAWSGRDLASMRPYLSDALFTTQSFWVSEYLRQGLQNCTENAQIHNVELSRVTTDAYFDAITVRVWASSLEFTLSDRDGKVVAGNRSAPRRYTEYWTFIRSSRAKGPPKTEAACPRCGAPLNVNMGGQCTYCQAKVTTGDFDWVLSRIEQDEVYVG